MRTPVAWLTQGSTQKLQAQPHVINRNAVFLPLSRLVLVRKGCDAVLIPNRTRVSKRSHAHAYTSHLVTMPACYNIWTNRGHPCFYNNEMALLVTFCIQIPSSRAQSRHRRPMIMLVIPYILYYKRRAYIFSTPLYPVLILETALILFQPIHPYGARRNTCWISCMQHWFPPRLC